MRTRRLAVTTCVVLLLAACAGSRPAGEGGNPAAGATAPGPVDADPASAPAELAWRHLGMVEATLPDRRMAKLVTDAAQLTDAWQTHGFAGDAPAVDFDHRVVLLLAQPDDACPDELARLDAVEGELVVEWQSPPGPCNEPLILRLHAVEVHRGHLPSEVAVSPPELFAGDLEPVTISVPAGDGPPSAAPPVPDPPAAMTPQALDAVFAGTGVAQCDPDDLRLGAPQVDGRLSDDPAVAAAQRQRADEGLPSDEASTREALEHPEALELYEATVTPEEAAAERARSALADEAAQALQAAGVAVHEDAEILIDRFGRYGSDRGVEVFVGEDDVDATQDILDRALGEGKVTARYNGFDPAEQRDVQEALASLFDSGSTEPGAITSTSGSIGPVVIGMVDPTREALEEIAETVDPSRVCVEPQLTGASP